MNFPVALRRAGATALAGLLVLGASGAVLPSPAAATATVSGPGSITAQPGDLAHGDSGVTVQFVYTVDGAHPLVNGEVDVTVPAGWTTPTTTPPSLPNDAGHVRASAGTPSVVAGSGGTSIIQVKAVTLTSGTLTISYGDRTGTPAGPGLTISETPGNYSFPAAVATDAASPPAALTPAQIGVAPANGTGTTTVTPEHAQAGSTGNTLTFTYTPAAGGELLNGEVDIPVPAGWSAPTSANTPGAAGVVSASTGTAAVSGNTIRVTGLTIGAGAADASVAISYANAAPPAGPSDAAFGPVLEASVAGDAPVATSSTPTVAVAAADGSGTVTTAPSVVSSHAAVTETFTITAPAGGMENGEVDITVPANWTPPTVTAGSAGFTDVPSGSTGTVGQVTGSGTGPYTVAVTGITLTAGQTTTVVYGDGGAPAVTPDAPGSTQSFGVAEASVSRASGGTPTGLPSVPVNLVGIDGGGTMAVSPTSAPANSSANTFTFTFTPPAGGMDHGQLVVANPSGWPKPTTSPGQPGSVSADQGTIAVDPNTNAIVVSGLTRPAGQSGQVTITYSNVTTPNMGGATFTTSESSSASSSPVALPDGSQPTVTLTAANGSGSMAVDKTFVASGSTGNTLTFTFTAPTGGLVAGEVDLTIPSGWTAPQTGPGAGQVTASGGGGTMSISGTTVQVQGVTLVAGGHLTITYADATAPATRLVGQRFVAASAPSGGVPSELASGSPKIDVAAAPGSGTIAVTPTEVINGSSSNTLNFVYTAAPGGLIGGEVDVAVPAGWTAPQTTSSSLAGFVTASAGTLTLSGSTIKVTGLNLAEGDELGISYRNATAPGSDGADVFATEDSTDPGHGTTLTALTAGQPTIQVITNAPDGSGTITPGTQSASAGNASTTLSWVYTAPLGGLASGQVDLAIPSGWTAPTTNGGAGLVTASIASGQCAPAGGQACTVSTSSGTVHVSGLTLAQGTTLTITYAAAAVPNAPGTAADFTVSEQSTPSGHMTPLAGNTQPVVDITAADGAGVCSISPDVVSAGSGGLNMALACTENQAGGMENGEVDVTVPDGWTAPSTSSGSAGSVVADQGTVSTSGQTIVIRGVTLKEGDALNLTYGNVTAASSTGPAVFDVADASSGSGTPAAVAAGGSPTVTVTAEDGSGTADVSPLHVAAGDTGRTFTMTYTPATGGLIDGEVDVAVPPGWPQPTTAPGQPDTVTASTGSVAIDPVSGDVVVRGLTLGGAGQPPNLVITYGAGGGDTGVTVPGQTGPAGFGFSEASANGDTPSGVGQGQQIVNVAAANGSGSMTVVPANVPAGAHQQLTFTYTASAGGLSGGEVDLQIPTGWTAPTLATGSPGYTTVSGGTTTPGVKLAGQTIEVTNVTLDAGSALSILYGAGSGGQAVAPAHTGPSTFPAAESSVPDDAVETLGASPAVNVVAPDGGGTMTATPGNVLAGSANEIDLTYTAPAGGLAGGEVDATVPSGWTAPQTTNPLLAGVTTASPGTVTVNGNTIRVTGLTLAQGATMTIRYGAPTTGMSGGSATAPSSAVLSTFAAASSATGGAPAPLAASPTVDVIQPAADGTGNLGLNPSDPVAAGSAGHTYTITYTPASGGTLNGEVDVNIPSGWTPPSTTAGQPGLTTVNTGTLALSGQTIKVSGLNVGSGNTAQLIITYGAGGGTTGVSIPASPTGAAAFTAQEKSTSGGTLTALPQQTVNVVAADGSGTDVVSPSSVAAGTTTDLTFTYTPATGGLSGGELDIAVPAGWTGGTPHSSAGAPAYHNGTLSVTGLSGTSPVTATLSGVTAPGGPTTSTFTTSVATVAGDQAEAIGNSPQVTVTGVPAARVSPGGVDFGTVTPGATSPAQAITVSSSGSAPLHIASVIAPSPFRVTGDNCTGATIAPGSSCSVSVVFGPSGPGQAAGALTVNDDAASSPQTVALSGNGDSPNGYWMVGSRASVYNFGQAGSYGDPSGVLPAGAHAVHIEPAPDNNGYWVLADNGAVYAFGSAPFLGDAPALPAGERPASLSATPSGQGYWIFTDHGRALAFGDADFFGDMRATPLNGPVVDSVATPTGRGYYMVGADGGIFAFGDAQFHGSMGGQHLNGPIVGLAPTPSGAGYWLVASDGGIFAFGDAAFRGSMGGQHLNQPVIGAVAYGDGYLMVAADGGIFDFSDKAFSGSLGSNPPANPIVGVAVVHG